MAIRIPRLRLSESAAVFCTSRHVIAVKTKVSWMKGTIKELEMYGGAWLYMQYFVVPMFLALPRRPNPIVAAAPVTESQLERKKARIYRLWPNIAQTRMTNRNEVEDTTAMTNQSTRCASLLQFPTGAANWEHLNLFGYQSEWVTHCQKLYMLSRILG